MNESYLAIDANTGAIDANHEGGKELIQAISDHSEDTLLVIFFDVNFLGDINYFQNGYHAGDQILEIFSRAMRNHLRKSDLMLKLGGDEFVFIVQIDQAFSRINGHATQQINYHGHHSHPSNPHWIEELLNRMIESVQKSPESLQIFENERNELRRYYNTIKQAKEIKDLGYQLLNKLPDETKIDAIAHFSDFREACLEGIERLLEELDRMRPSISMGSVVTGPGASIEEALEMAQNQSKKVKIQFRNQLGMSATKHKQFWPQRPKKDNGTSPSHSPPPPAERRSIRPIVFPPEVLVPRQKEND